jgi:hypothetical protein
MPTKEIPRDGWVAFFDSFSQQHRGWLISLEVLDHEFGDQVEASGLPLEGISAEIDSSADRIEIIAGKEPDSHITHTIIAPASVWLKQTEEGADEALEIESDGSAVIIHFRSAVRPEMVDWIV